MVTIDEFMFKENDSRGILFVNTILLERLRERRAEIFTSEIRARIAQEQAEAILWNRIKLALVQEIGAVSRG